MNGRGIPERFAAAAVAMLFAAAVSPAGAAGVARVTITETPQVSQPAPFSSGGRTVVVPRTRIIIEGDAQQAAAPAPSKSDNVKDPTPMIRIPGGAFTMGSDDGPADRRPAHKVVLKPFLIDKTPVTNAAFARFLNAVGTTANKRGENLYDWEDSDARIHIVHFRFQADPGYENHPVVEVSWFGARDYCHWVGKRLPTEAEWERAAKGVAGRPFPWGAEAPKGRARFDVGWNETAAVDAHPKGATPEGVLDMAGNAYDWVSSLYMPYPYDAKDGREDLTSPFTRGTRGGSADDVVAMLSTTERGEYVSRNPFGGHHHIGFRCARAVD